jgi:hypothetical protein
MRQGISAGQEDRGPAALSAGIRDRESERLRRVEAELARSKAIVDELEQGSKSLDEVGQVLARRRPLRDWVGRLVEFLAFWRRRASFVETRGMGRLQRAQYREMVRFARETGNAAILECLRPR